MPGFGSRLIFRGHTRQGRSFGNLLDPHLLGSTLGGTSFGFCPLGGQPGQISLSPGAGGRGRCEFGGGPLAALGLGQGALLRFDLYAQGSRDQVLGLHLLCGRRFGLGCHAPGLCRAGLLLGGQTSGGGARGLRFLLGAALRLPRCLLFCRHAQQGGCFGALLDPQLLGGLIGRASLGFGPLCGQPGQFLFLFDPGRGGGGQLGRNSLIAPGIFQRALFGLDISAQFSHGPSLGKFAAAGFHHGALLRFDSRAERRIGEALGLLLLCRSRLRLGCRTLRLRSAGLLLGSKARDGGTRGCGFLLGAVTDFGGRLIFSGYTRRGRRFGDLLEPQLFDGLLGGTSFGGGTFRRQAGQLLFLLHASRGGGGQFNAGTLAALGLRHGTLLRFDLRGKRGSSQTFGFDLPCSGLSLRCRALGLCRVGLLLGRKARRSGARCFGFLLGASAGFAGRLIFSGRTRQGGRCGDLLDPKLLGGLIGRASFGFGPLRCEPGQLFFLLDPGGGGNGQFSGSSLIAPGFLQRALLGLDLGAKGGFGETFGLCLGCRALGLCGIGLLLGGEARNGGTSCFGLLFGATPGFAGRLIFHGRTCPRGGFGFPFDTQLLGGLIGRVSLRGSALCGHQGQFLFLPDPGRGDGGQVGSGALIALGFAKALLLFRDSSP